MLDNIQLDQEEDVDPPVELFNWGAGVTPAQRADIANLFANMSTFATSRSFHQHPPVLPVAGIYTAANQPPVPMLQVLCSAKLAWGFVQIVLTDPYFAGLAAGHLFDLNIGANPTFHTPVNK